MTLSEIQEKVKRDLKINDMELDIESLRIPSLHSKYLQLLTENSLKLKKANGELSVLRRNKWIYYTGKASEEVYKEKGDFPLKLKTKDEERTFIEADEEFARFLFIYQKRKLCPRKEVVSLIDHTDCFPINFQQN